MEQQKPSIASPEAGKYERQGVAEQLPAGGERGQERVSSAEAARQAPAQGPTLPVPQALGAALRPVRPVAVNPVADDNPLVAADEDVIEREWVDRAKKIVSQTKNDPRQQEKEVSRLQADYLKKRYGKEIKLVGD